MFKLIGLLIAVSIHSNLAASAVYTNVHYLEHGEKMRINPSGSSGLELQTFCYKGRKKFIIYTWQSVIFQLHHPSDEYTLFEGSSPEEVQSEYSKNRFYWSPNLFMIKQKSFKVDPFNTTCVGVRSFEGYTVQYNVINLDFWKLLLLGIGVGIFLSADTLSKNTIFHFISGIVFGVCASILVLIYFTSKLFPRRPLMYGVLGMGWTLVIYIGHLIWDNVQVILTEYKFYVLWYMVITGFVSFIWLCSIFNSSNYQEAAMAQIVILLISYNLPQKWKTAPKTYWKKRFPPKVRLLNNEEFYQEGVRETAKALDSLRQYCSSPECNQWKTVLKLKDVKRFASFIEGNSHLSDDEILEYETFVHDLTDDENDLTDEEEY
ncbi:unnamed protein product [Psylliodes chrysocephalus]|uniref:Nuclear envelope integral membrane protein 1 n=1 Tax=Psylliodes chrysocephalus TaxID=3402493 RepID=A0A9P0D012_9CUCU|nr:unnamed protein product [Psylliodes chrysocephala]